MVLLYRLFVSLAQLPVFTSDTYIEMTLLSVSRDYNDWRMIELRFLYCVFFFFFLSCSSQNCNDIMIVHLNPTIGIIWPALFRNFSQPGVMLHELLFGYSIAGYLSDKASWGCEIGWGQARKSKSCHYFYTWGRLANNRYESGTAGIYTVFCMWVYACALVHTFFGNLVS